MFALCLLNDKKKIYDLNKKLAEQKEKSEKNQELDKQRLNAEMIKKMLPNFKFKEIDITRSSE